MSTIANAHTCFMRGDLSDAEQILDALLKRNKGDVDALSLLAGVKHARGDMAGALALFERAVELSPYDILIVFNRAALLAAMGRHEPAVAGYAAAIKLRPDDGMAHFGHGVSLAALGRHDEAIDAFAVSLKFGGASADAHAAHAASLSALKRHTEALSACDAALALDPNHERALVLRGVTLVALERPEEALAALDAALARAPQGVRARAVRSTALANLGRFDEALAEIDGVLAQQPDQPDHWSRRGYVLSASNRDREAIAAYDRLLALKPGVAEAIYAKADALLSVGDFANGLPLYESREQKHAPPPSPRWTGGEEISGRSILVLGEQGFGDLFQFCRFIPILAERGARVVLQERAPTLRLMQSLSGGAQLVSRNTRPPVTDFHIPIASLMLALGVTLETIPSSVPYLHAEPERVDHWRSVLGAASRKRVGVCWAGGGGLHAMQLWRKLDVSALARLLEADVEFASLQFDSAAERDLLAKRGVREFGDATADFAELAALIESLDLVITIDTGVAHLAGALGKPVWVLLPFRADWRWMRERTDSPWYPTARLFRQQQFGDWDSVIAAVHAALQ